MQEITTYVISFDETSGAVRLHLTAQISTGLVPVPGAAPAKN
jgi:hypothetical protein